MAEMDHRSQFGNGMLSRNPFLDFFVLALLWVLFQSFYDAKAQNGMEERPARNNVGRPENFAGTFCGVCR